MQDLSSYQSDPVTSSPGSAQSGAAQHRTRPIMRSKSESYKGKETSFKSAIFTYKTSGFNSKPKRSTLRFSKSALFELL